MPDPRVIIRNGHRTWLKWHRGRRRAGDPVFTGRRIHEGMRLGASVEVDLVIHADRGYAVLHDLTLERETTGAGRVVDCRAETLRALNLRGNDGRPIPDRVMLLEDLGALLAEGPIHPDALLQLDFKEDAAALDATAIAAFKASVRPVARHMILSSGDADAVRLLAEDVEGLRVGYDPCYGPIFERLEASRDFSAFAAEALAAAPEAEMIYLDYGLVLAADRAGFDLIGAFHNGGRRVDAWTIPDASPASLAAAERLLALKADQITTDDPEGLAMALEASF
ncbi:glycerophosphodiester phosphodiesterase [Chelativorans xinjiangense]|uniref:glycerophosphodiester phosphodiesterase n=1 Tax=Chelativorans xinjiangense TaxID=2681485 RepID=UPI0013584B35|nr:glycerophosphodiester phosphodiesterase family protein [Chelativorans xinjiangense]